MRVRVDETRQYRFSAEIDLSNARRCQIDHVRVFSNGEKSAARYSDSFCNGFGGIHRHDVAVMQNELRFFLFEGKQRESSKRTQKLTASRSVSHRASSSLIGERCGCYAASG